MKTLTEMFMVRGTIANDIARIPARMYVEFVAIDMPSPPISVSSRVVAPAVRGKIMYGSAAPRFCTKTFTFRNVIREKGWGYRVRREKLIISFFRKLQSKSMRLRNLIGPHRKRKGVRLALIGRINQRLEQQHHSAVVRWIPPQKVIKC